MSPRDEELLRFYRRHRVDDQIGFYDSRRKLFDRATAQAGTVSATLLGFATAAAALAGTDAGPRALWAVLATVLPAAVTALAAYTTLYAFDRQSKIYEDAYQAARAASRTGIEDGSTPPTAAEVVSRVEAALRAEQAQWGQLTAQIEIPDATRE